jgi:SAM-dependent methyltransferase
MTPEQLQSEIDALAPWFYPFELASGVRTRSHLPREVVPIFETRLEMVRRVVTDHFGPRLPQVECADLGCHEGFYSIAMKALGVRRVVGLDVREENLRKARFVTSALGHPDIELVRGDLEELPDGTLGSFDLTLLLGVLYHLANPMACLRRVARMTRELLVVETQVVDEVVKQAEWGARAWSRPYQGILALIDESSELAAGAAETGASGLVCCPSPRAVEAMLKAAGFSRVETIAPPRGAYEQHRRGKRIVCAAYK